METKEIIAQKTLGLLLKKGYDGVSVSDIQQETGMARGLLYHYFGNQSQLFGKVTEQYLNDWFLAEKQTSGDKALGEMIGIVVSEYHRIVACLSEQTDGIGVLWQIPVLFQEVARKDREFAQVYEAFQNRRYALWKTAVLNSFAAGELRSGLNLESVARHFVWTVEGCIGNWEGEENPLEKVYRLERSLQEFLEMIRR